VNKVRGLASGKWIFFGILARKLVIEAFRWSGSGLVGWRCAFTKSYLSNDYTLTSCKNPDYGVLGENLLISERSVLQIIGILLKSRRTTILPVKPATSELKNYAANH
jgi:hypothetical protein